MSLRILSLNLWALSPPISRDNGPRMRAIGAALAGFELDAAALWEPFSPMRCRFCGDGARKAKLPPGGPFNFSLLDDAGEPAAIAHFPPADPGLRFKAGFGFHGTLQSTNARGLGFHAYA